MKKTPRYTSGALRPPADQHGAPATDDGRMLDFPFDQDPGAGIESADRLDPGAVFVTERKVKQQVLGGMDAQLIQ